MAKADLTHDAHEAESGGAPPAASQLVLGVDGGGTRTAALLALRNGDLPDCVIGRGVAGPSNYQAIGRAKALEALDAAIDGAFCDAGVSRGSVGAACLGLAGADRPADREMLTAWAQSVRLAARVQITNDAVLVISAGTPHGWGLAVIAGTGSFALARSEDGRMRRSGGWGYLLGDEGSSYQLAVKALRAVACAADGRGPATMLTDQFLTRLGIDSLDKLVPAIYRPEMDRAGIAGLGDVVTRAAESGDHVAIEIVQKAGDELSEVAAAATRLFSGDSQSAVTVPTALAGSVLLSCELLRRRFIEGLRARNVEPSPMGEVREPALGAIRLARAAET